ncbi:hypothetical protein Tco_0325457, partial [Tanacetum coccineum]
MNFFNPNTLNDLPDIPNDEERRNPSPKRHGTPPPPHSGSPSAPLIEDDGGHFPGANAFVSKGERSADLKENIVNSEGDGLQNHHHEGISQDNDNVQNLRWSSIPSIFPRNFNDFVVDSKVKHMLEIYLNYSN